MKLYYWCFLFLLILINSSSTNIRKTVQQAPHPQYLRLEQALQQYRTLAANHEWVYFPGNIRLHPGDSNEYVSSLRRVLSLAGDLKASDSLSHPLFDEALTKAVKGFQQRHGLVADGVVGQETLQELNVSPSQRLRQIEVNLMRWKAFNKETALPLVFVNIPDYTLQLLDTTGQTIWTTRVVVGKPAKAFQTKPIDSNIKHLVLNPSWNIPQSIYRKEIIPILQKDRGYLARNHMVLYRQQGNKKTSIPVNAVNWHKPNLDRDGLRVVQVPGPWNSLGKVKFLFPTSYAQYLHDTPAKSLFMQPYRAYSHGCVRVQHPDTLAAFLLSENWMRKKDVQALWATSTPDKRVYLPKPVQVKLGYFTCWVDDRGVLQFRRDIYKRDVLPAHTAIALYRK